MFEFPLLLADIDNIIKVLIPLVGLVIWILSQVFGQKANRPDAPPAGNPRPQADQGGLRHEIERFLREAQQQAQEQERQPRNEPQRENVGASEEEIKQERLRRKKEEKQRNQARQRAKELAAGSQRKLEPAVVEDVEVVGPRASVSQHVSNYMDTSGFRERASHLGEEVGLADERLEAHLQQAFSHPAGGLSDKQSVVSLQGEYATRNMIGGAQLAAMLRNPNTFRQAIVLNEILNRPADRW